MINQTTFSSLNIEGKNTLHENNDYRFDQSANLSNDEISNYILNSNIEDHNTIK